LTVVPNRVGNEMIVPPTFQTMAAVGVPVSSVLGSVLGAVCGLSDRDLRWY
jgi:hypothetical protein